MLEKLEKANDRFREVERLLSAPDAVSDAARYRDLSKEYSTLSPIVGKYREYKESVKARDEAEELMHAEDAEPELRALAEEEYLTMKKEERRLFDELRVLLIPKDPSDTKNVIVEIRPAAGGEEAALFAADLYRMYSMYAARRGFRIEVLNLSETGLGGLKEITFSVIGQGAYAAFKYESGVHRVQRIPVTESNGRIQTSTVTVAVLPEAEDIEVEILPQDIRFETCKSSGAGGQHINKTESAVRLIHKPSGIVVECDGERSQLQNKERALHVLKTKLYDIKQREQTEGIAATRKSQVGSGDRSEKIRTYNFPQSRVTDHRINRTLYTLDDVMNGGIDPLVEELTAVETAEKLKGEE